jgi:hypothetical protein
MAVPQLKNRPAHSLLRRRTKRLAKAGIRGQHPPLTVQNQQRLRDRLHDRFGVVASRARLLHRYLWRRPQSPAPAFSVTTISTSVTERPITGMSDLERNVRHTSKPLIPTMFMSSNTNLAFPAAQSSGRARQYSPAGSRSHDPRSRRSLAGSGAAGVRSFQRSAFSSQPRTFRRIT